MLNIVLYVSYVIQYDSDIELVSKIDSIRRHEVMNVIDEAFIGGFWKGVDPNGGVVLLDADWVQWEIVGHDLWMTAFIHLGLDKISGDRKLLVSVNEALMHMGRDIGSSAIGRQVIDIFPTGPLEHKEGDWVSGVLPAIEAYISTLCDSGYDLEVYIELSPDSKIEEFAHFLRDNDLGKNLSIEVFEGLESPHVARVLEGPGIVIRKYQLGFGKSGSDSQLWPAFSDCINQLHSLGSCSSILLDFHV